MHREALEQYLGAEAALEVYESARVILSSRLCEVMDRLLRDLRSNAAAAALKLEQWEVAVTASTAVLADEPTHAKALYRRASAYLGWRRDANDVTAATKDLQVLLKAQPSNAAARALLDGI